MFEHVTETCRASIVETRLWTSERRRRNDPRRESGIHKRRMDRGAPETSSDYSCQGFTRHNNRRHERECSGRVYLNTIRVSRAELLTSFTPFFDSNPLALTFNLPSFLPVLDDVICILGNIIRLKLSQDRLLVELWTWKWTFSRCFEFLRAKLSIIIIKGPSCLNIISWYNIIIIY